MKTSRRAYALFLSVCTLCLVAAAQTTWAGSPPYQPQAIYPSDGATDIWLCLDGTDGHLEWLGGDPDGDNILYYVFLDDATPPGNLIATRITESCPVMALPLYDGTTFYWQIQAQDQDGSTWSNIFSFTTRTASNTGCGDADYTPDVTVADLSHLVNYLFYGGCTAVPWPCLGDVDCWGGVNVADLSYLVDYLFLNGPPPCPGCC